MQGQVGKESPLVSQGCCTLQPPAQRTTRDLYIRLGRLPWPLAKLRKGYGKQEKDHTCWAPQGGRRPAQSAVLFLPITEVLVLGGPYLSPSLGWLSQ